MSDYKWVGLKEYEDFAVENCCGTQLKIAKYIKRLFDEGHEFKKKANEMIEKDYGEGKSAKKFYEHRLVNDN